MSNHVQSAELTPDDVSNSERRGEIRHDAARLGKISARLIGGSEVSLVNFSNRGLLFESDSRLLIGARASVRLTTTDANLVVTGRVVRSRVKGVVNGALRYDAALNLDAELTLVVPEDPADNSIGEPDGPPVENVDDVLDAAARAEQQADAGVSAADAQPPVDLSARQAPEWEPVAETPPAAEADPDDAAVVQLYATVPHDLAELRRLAADNQW